MGRIVRSLLFSTFITFLSAVALAQPSVNLIMPKANLVPGDSLILDLEMKSEGLTSNVDLFFSVEVGPFPFYLDEKLNFVTDKVPVVSNFKPLDFKVRVFGLGSILLPSVFGEFIILPEVTGSFTWVAEIFDFITGISISIDKIQFTASPSMSLLLPNRKEVISHTKVWKLSYPLDFWDEKITDDPFDFRGEGFEFFPGPLWLVLRSKDKSIDFFGFDWEKTSNDSRSVFEIAQSDEEILAMGTEIIETTTLFTTAKGIQGAYFINAFSKEFEVDGFNRSIFFKNDANQRVRFAVQSKILANVKSLTVEDILNSFEFISK